MLVDSHCHLNRIELSEFSNQIDTLLLEAKENDVGHFLSVCVDPSEYPDLCKLADSYPNISISVGLHPNDAVDLEPDHANIVKLANAHKSCIAVGETGLDYYRVEDSSEQEAQRQRFREHIWAAIETKKPLIIHTRQASEDTLAVMQSEALGRIAGVMHCFSEDWSVAKRAIDMGFYISLSGIITFKSATALREVAKKIPLDYLLIETDAPYLAPTPFRGSQNHPALVKYVALALAELKEISYEKLALQTTLNFQKCFNLKWSV